MGNVKSSIKESAGIAKEEVGEAFGNKKMAQKGREMRNEGRMEKGKIPKNSTPGKGKK